MSWSVYNSTSKVFQSANLDINTALDLCASLAEFVDSMRSKFSEIEQEAKSLSECETYKYEGEGKRPRKRNKKYDGDFGSTADDHAVSAMSASDKFRTQTYIVIIDHLLNSLRSRCNAYRIISSRYGFCDKLLVSLSKPIQRISTSI